MHSLSLKVRVKKFCEELNAYFYLYDTDRVEYNTSNSYSIVGYIFVVAVTFLPSRCLAMIGVFLPSRCLATVGGYTHRHTD